MPENLAPRWLVLIHQIPKAPAYLRVKVGRRLQGLGAVAVKNSVYVLPLNSETLEDFQWVRREIVSGGGEASVCEARFVEGLSDRDVEGLFSAAREADYAALAREARAFKAWASRREPKGAAKEKAKASLLRLRRRLAEIVEVDFFGAAGRDAVEGPLVAVEAALSPKAGDGVGPAVPPGLQGRTWVTRAGVHVDRIASAWLIRRFIDPDARFRFVKTSEGVAEGELRFDMYEAEFTHEGDLCTFEVLLRRFGLEEKPLARLGEIVHDIDLKDGKYSHPETPGLDHLVAGIALAHTDDEARLQAGAGAFEALYEYFRRKG